MSELLIMNIPDELKIHPQWVGWKLEAHPGQDRLTKPPYQVHNSSMKASATDPSTWASFTDALRALDNGIGFSGIGIVFTEDDGFFGIDLDDAIRDGKIELWAQEIVDIFPGAYMEITPSKTGLHIIGKGKLPGRGRKDGPVEVYDRGRYFTMTGHALPSSGTDIIDLQAALDVFLERYFPVVNPHDGQSGPGKSFLIDKDVIGRALAAQNGEKFSKLWNGDITGYPSPSEARAALLMILAFWTNRDPDAMDRLFSQSGLYNEKWNSRRGQDTYGHREIMIAISRCTETYTPPQEPEGSDDKSSKKKDSQADTLMKLAEGNVQDWFIDQYREAHARFRVGDHFEVWPILGRDFRDWLGGLFYSVTEKGCGPDAMRTALSTCSAKARFGGSGEHELHVRVTEHEGAIWYDLADAGWRSIKITSSGWEIVSDTPILFRRLRNTGTQVEPVRGGDIDGIFQLVKIKDVATRTLFKAWLIAALVPNIPHPAMVIYGPQGSAKTSAFRAIKGLLDPGTKKTDTAPRVPSDLVKLLHNQWFSGFDNLSMLPSWVSDCFCRAVTGDGYSERLLYTNNDELVLTFRRVIAMNGINIVATRPDLLDRSILIGLDRIDEGARISEAEVEDRMRRLLPGILGGALDLLVKVLKVQHEIVQRVRSLPRMADFALLGCAIAEVLGMGSDTFLDIYRENLGVQHQEVINNNPIATALIMFMEKRPEWIGSPGDLLGNLKSIGSENLGINDKSSVWPGAPNALVRKLNILKTNLGAVGIEIEQKHENTGSRLKITNNNVTTVTTVTRASIQGLQGDNITDPTLTSVTDTVTPNQYRHDSITLNHKESCVNDNSDGIDDISPILGDDTKEGDYEIF